MWFWSDFAWSHPIKSETQGEKGKKEEEENQESIPYSNAISNEPTPMVQGPINPHPQ